MAKFHAPWYTSLAVERFPLGDVFLGIHERKDGAGNDWDVGAANDFEQAQGVLNFFVAPGVAGNHGDAKHVGIRRIDERENGLHVGAAGPGAVLINDDFAFGLGSSHRCKYAGENKDQDGAAAHGERENSS